MASKYYNDVGKEVYNGDVAAAADLNDINTAVDTAFELVEADLDGVLDDVQYYTGRSQEWAENPEDVEVVSGEYSALHWAAKAEEFAGGSTHASLEGTDVHGLGTSCTADTIGTVSESGGVPTGSIIESGSNAYGNYTKWADGTMEQWDSSNDYVTIATTWGDIKKSASEAVTLPEAFASSDYVVSASVELGGIAPWVGLTYPVDASSFNIVFYAAVSTSSYTDGWSWRAIGRWF